MVTNLSELLEKTLPPLGYEVVDWEASPGGRLVRVFIDKPNGVDVEDCARVSRHLTRLFAVENIDFDRLEVSSPGLDRPLKKAADFVRFTGAEAELRLVKPVDNARRVKGVLRGCEEGAVRVETRRNQDDRAGRHRPGAARPRIEWRNATEPGTAVGRCACAKERAEGYCVHGAESALASATKKRFPTRSTRVDRPRDATRVVWR
jgi:ribosome maturation factor RimP